MPRNRPLSADYRASWLALLAMLLLSVGPLLSQLTASAKPAWLTELACGEHAGSHDNPLDHDALWAKCGYCTLLLNSPATGCVSPTLALSAQLFSLVRAAAHRLPTPDRHCPVACVDAACAVPATPWFCLDSGIPMSTRSLLISAAPFRLAPLCVGLLLATQTHAAQTTAHDPEQHALQLPPSVVTAVQQSSPLTVVADPKDPRQPVPASDAADYLKTIPGFSAIRSGGSNSDPVLRGMFGSRLLLLTDGGQMLGACPGRMDAPSSYISPETFDLLTVTKGPQTVIWGPGASAGVVRFDRAPESFGELGARLHASVLAGSNGRFDQTLDGAVGGERGYLRVTRNRSHSDDYDNGNGDTIPSRWDKWNSDVALGWTPDADALIELTAGKGDGEARYGGRSMDGTQFQRESLGLRVERSNLGGVLDKVEAKVYYNYADHIMDNFRLRMPDPTSMMSGPIAAQVDRRPLGARLAATWAWEDVELVTGP